MWLLFGKSQRNVALEKKRLGVTNPAPKTLIIFNYFNCAKFYNKITLWNCLAEVHYLLMFYNVVDDELLVTRLPNINSLRTIYLTSGRYQKWDIADTINKFINESDVKVVIDKHIGKLPLWFSRTRI